MIKINIEINEKETKELHNILAKGINIDVKEIRQNATAGEKVASDYLRQKLEIVREENIINKCEQKENKDIVELLKSILK